MTLTSTQTRWAEPTQVATKGWEWPSPWIARPSTGVTESTSARPGALTRMYVERGVSPWLDHLSREDLVDGRMSRMVAAGVRGVGAGQVGVAQALELSADYDEQLSWLLGTGCTAQEAYWELAAADALAACAILRSVHEMSQGADGFVSLQVPPAQPRRTRATVATICQLHRRIDRPNLLVAIPATASGVQALRATVSAGWNIGATSVFSLARYAAVIDAYQSGLEALVARGGDPTTVHSVASFSLSPVDAEVDRRIEQLGSRGALELRGLAATAQAVLACQLFEERFATERWARLANRGANPQRLAWASAGTDLETARGQRYLEALSVPNTVHVLSASTVATLNSTGLGTRAPGIDSREAAGVVSELAALRIDLDDVAAALETQSSALAQDSLIDALDRLTTRSGQR